MIAETLAEAEENIWQKYGGDTAYDFNVWEVENGETESFCVYYK